MIISSIDLMNGKAVQLRRGEEKVLEENDVITLANRFQVFGETAVIDLDRALGRGDNRETVRRILQVAECRVGGGIRTPEDAREMISWGAKKIIIGSRAFSEDRIDEDFLKGMAGTVGRERIIIAVDSWNDEIVTRGWRHRTGLNIFKTVPRLEPYCSGLLFTCVEKEGMMQGSDRERILHLKECTNLKITAAGGIATLDEIKEFSHAGIDVQLGMAIYTGAVDLADGFIAGLNWQKDLIPTIARDEQGNVLMLAYSNPDSLRRTFSDRRVCYFSRSRKKLWTKGETSGHVQELVRIRADCDRDTLLVTVKQTGPACHENKYSCFGDQTFTLQDLETVIRERMQTAPAGSYTAGLSEGDIREKLREESEELIEADKFDELVWEAADLLYFTLAYLAKKNVPLSAVMKELERRRKK